MDKWADWIVSKRYGNDEKYKTNVLNALYPIRDAVIRNADVKDGDTVLDVGCGDGLIANALIEKVGTSGKVIFSDISKDLLESCRSFYEQENQLENLSFVQASVDNLEQIGDQSIDAVTCRSVLIYVDEKNKSFAEFFRVLKKGGRLSVFEPINSFAQKRRDEKQFMGYDLSPLGGIGEKFLQAYRKEQKQNDPMTNFDERDLIAFSEQVGFNQIQIEFTAQMGFGAKFPSWDFLYEFSPNPNAPALSESLSKHLTLVEKEQFISYLKPLVEHTHPKISSAICYLSAKK
jgi:ubiquinone/menaquinone biosynthesis C-methylase UbiE